MRHTFLNQYYHLKVYWEKNISDINVVVCREPIIETLVAHYRFYGFNYNITLRVINMCVYTHIQCNEYIVCTMAYSNHLIRLLNLRGIYFVPTS